MAFPNHFKVLNVNVKADLRTKKACKKWFKSDRNLQTMRILRRRHLDYDQSVLLDQILGEFHIGMSHVWVKLRINSLETKTKTETPTADGIS